MQRLINGEQGTQERQPGQTMNTKELQKQSLEIVPESFLKIVSLFGEIDQQKDKASTDLRIALVEILYQVVNVLSNVSVMYDEELKNECWSKELITPFNGMIGDLYRLRQWYDDGYVFGGFVCYICIHGNLRPLLTPFLLENSNKVKDDNKRSPDDAMHTTHCKDRSFFQVLDMINCIQGELDLSTLQEVLVDLKLSDLIAGYMNINIDDLSEEDVLTQVNSFAFLDWYVVNNRGDHLSNTGKLSCIAQYTNIKIVKRCLQFPQFFPQKHYREAIWGEYKSMVKNKNISYGIQQNMEIIMEVVDHCSGIDFVGDNDHLLLLLSASIKTIHEYILQDPMSNVMNLHEMCLFKLKSTICLPSIFNIVSIILTKNLIQSNDIFSIDGEEDSKREESSMHDVFHLLGINKDYLPVIPPISKSLFQFSSLDKVLPHECMNWSSNYETLITCLINVQKLNYDLLSVYSGLDIFSSTSPNATKTTHTYKQDEIFTMNFFQPIVAILLLIKQLSLHRDDISHVYCNGEKQVVEQWQSVLRQRVQHLLDDLILTDETVFFKIISYLNSVCLKTFIIHKECLQLVKYILQNGGKTKRTQLISQNSFCVKELIKLVENCHSTENKQLCIEIYKLSEIDYDVDMSPDLKDVDVFQLLSGLINKNPVTLNTSPPPPPQYPNNVQQRAMSGATNVNNGKKYILGGYQRTTTNNSRIQSIHIDEF